MDPESITSQIEFPPGRAFQVWAYTVGHSRLLLRSNRKEAFETRVELLLKSVDAVHLPTVLSGLTVRVVESGDELPPWADAGGGQKVYVVGFAGGQDYVVAGAAFVSEDGLDYAAPSAFAGSLGE